MRLANQEQDHDNIIYDKLYWYTIIITIKF